MMLVRSSRKNILKALQGRLLLHRAEGSKKSNLISSRLPLRRESYVKPKEGQNKQPRKQNERGASSLVACLSHLNIKHASLPRQHRFYLSYVPVAVSIEEKMRFGFLVKGVVLSV